MQQNDLREKADKEGYAEAHLGQALAVLDPDAVPPSLEIQIK